MSDESEFIRHVPCEACGSRNNNALYSDGHTYCFGCAATTKGAGTVATSTSVLVRVEGLIRGEYSALVKRKITEATCKHFGYSIGEHNGSSCHIANYHNVDGQLVAQKIRRADKTFAWLGDPDDALPFGAQCWPKTGRQIVVTEGELDALSMSQVNGNKYPVVSIASGAGPQVKKYIAKHADYFKGFEKVILMFDADEKGQAAAVEAAKVIGSRAYIAEIPGDGMKDANDLLVAGKTDVMIGAMWQAKQYRPEGIVSMKSLREAVMLAPSWGLSYPWKGLDQMTYGAHTGEIITLVAGTGVGKTDVLLQCIEHLITAHGEGVGAFMLESSPVQAAKLLAGKHAGKRFHIPNVEGETPAWTDEELVTAFDEVAGSGRVFLYDSFGANDWEPIKAKIEYLYHTEGIKYFVLDHLTALTAGEEDQRTALDTMMEDMASVVVKLGITIYLVSHLNRPKGDSHEEGGRVTLAHLRNSGSIAMWSWIVLALERNQQAEEEHERFTTTVRCLKMRRDGTKVGDTFFIKYDQATGLLNEVAAVPKDGTKGFTREGPEMPSDF